MFNHFLKFIISVKVTWLLLADNVYNSWLSVQHINKQLINLILGRIFYLKNAIFCRFFIKNIENSNIIHMIIY